MSNMSPARRKTIQAFYFLSQFGSIGSAFSGSMLGIYDYMNPGKRHSISAGNYAWIFGLGLAAASIGSFTAHKFQGQKIGATEEDHHALPNFPAELAPANWKTKLAEGSYIAFAFALTIANNYLLVAGLNAFFQNSKQSILPPGYGGISIFILKTIFFDMAFDTPSAHFEATEEIKEWFTDTKAGTLLSQFFYQIAKQPALHSIFSFWVQTAGVMNHTGSDTLGYILSVPSLSAIWSNQTVDSWVKLTNTPWVMYPLFASAAILFALNCIQTLFFEAAEIKENLDKLSGKNSKHKQDPLLYQRHIEKNIVIKLLFWQPKLKKPIEKGFYTQGPLHAFGDLLPVVLVSNDLLDRHGEVGTPFGIIISTLASLLVFAGSCWGTHHSEVTTAIHHFQKKSKDIEPSTTNPIALR